jgi:hypothetical protein
LYERSAEKDIRLCIRHCALGPKEDMSDPAAKLVSSGVHRACKTFLYFFESS